MRRHRVPSSEDEKRVSTQVGQRGFVVHLHHVNLPVRRPRKPAVAERRDKVLRTGKEDVLQHRLRIFGRAVLPERRVRRRVVVLAPDREASVLSKIRVEVAERHRDLRLRRAFVAWIRPDPVVELLHDLAIAP